MELKKLVNFIKEQDPSVKSTAEIFLYQGFWAIVFHKIAHSFYKHKWFFLARFISQIARFITLIEIHPGAQVATEVFIDHGTGVVIGETAIVGRRTVIFHGVTLGGTGKDTGKRHPTVGENVIIGANASILGPIIIGDSAKIGAGAVVLSDVEPFTTIVPEVARNINCEHSLRYDIELMRKRLEQIEKEKKC